MTTTAIATTLTDGTLSSGTHAAHHNALAAAANLFTGAAFNVKAYGAYGDGTSHPITSHDVAVHTEWLNTYAVGTEWDTVGWQEALSRAASSAASRIGSSVFSPGGTYRISQQLQVQGASGIRAAGVGGTSSASILKWYGGSASTMLLLNRTENSVLENLSFQNGNAASAMNAISLQWPGSGTYNTLNNILREVRISSMDVGILVGAGDFFSVAETKYEDVQIANCTTAGVRIQSANSQTNTFDHCRISSCVRGIDVHTSGSLSASEVFFGINSISDVVLADGLITNKFDKCYSEQSTAFLVSGGPSSVVCPTTIIGCYLAPPTSCELITFKLGGPLTLIGNEFGSNALPCTVGVGGSYPTPVYSFGNTFWDVPVGSQGFTSYSNNLLLNQADISKDSVTGAIRMLGQMNLGYSGNQAATFNLIRTDVTDPAVAAASRLVWNHGSPSALSPRWTLGNEFGGAVGTFYLYDNKTNNLAWKVDANDILDASQGFKIGTGATILKHLSATKTWDPASVASGASTTTTVTVTGAAAGDEVTCGFSNDLQGLTLTGYVSAADTVTVVLANLTGGAVDLASGTLRASVWKH